MAKNFKVGVVITGDSRGSVSAVQATNEELKALNKTTTRTAKNTNELKEETDSAAGSMSSFGSVVGVVGGALAALGIQNLKDDFLEVNTETERYKASLVTITGDAKLASTAFGALEEVASTMPFTLDQTINGFIKMRNLGLQPSEAALTSFGDTSAAMGKDLNQMIEAVADASTFEFERLKEFGIKAKQEGETVQFTFQGVTTTVAKESAEVVKYLQNIGEVSFAGSMEEQMRRLPGLFANLEDSTDSVFRAFGDAGATFLAQDILGIMIDDTNELAGTMDEAFEFMVGAIGHGANALHGLGIAYDAVEQSARVAVIGILSLWVELIEKVDELLTEFGEGVAEFFKPVTDIINEILNSETAGAIRGTLANIIGAENVAMMQAMGGAVGDFAEDLGTAATNTETMSGVIGQLQRDFDAAQTEIENKMRQELPSDVWDEYVATIRTRVDEAKGEVKGLDDVISDIDSSTNSAAEGADKFSVGLKDVGTHAANAEKDLQGFSNGVQKSFANLLSGSITDFGAFFDQIGNMAANTAANIAASFGFNFVFGSGQGGGFFGAGSGGGAAAISGGGVSGGAGLLGLAGGGGGMFSGLASNWGFGSNVAVDPFTGMPTSGSGFGFNAGRFGANLGAGVVGGYAGTQFGEAAFGRNANSNYGSMAGGIIGSMTPLGPVGTLIGSAIGGMLDAAFGSDGANPIFSLGSNLHGDGVGQRRYNGSDVNVTSGSPFGNMRLQTVDGGFAEDQADALFGIFDRLEGMETILASTLSDEEVAGVASSLAQRQAGIDGALTNLNLQRYMETRINIIFDAIGGDVDRAFDTLAASVSSSEFLENVEAFTETALQFSMLAESLADIETLAEVVAVDTRTLTERYFDAAQATKDLAGNFELTVDGMDQLSASLEMQREIALTLVADLNTLSGNVDTTFESAIKAIHETTLSERELYAVRQAEFTDLRAQLGGTTDPGEIARITSQLLSTSNSAFGLLDESGQNQNAAAFIEALQGVQALAQEKIAEGISDAQAEQNTVIESVVSAIETVGQEQTNVLNSIHDIWANQNFNINITLPGTNITIPLNQVVDYYAGNPVTEVTTPEATASGTIPLISGGNGDYSELWDIDIGNIGL